MNRVFAFGLVGALGSALHAQTVNVHGKVSNGTGQPVANAVVELMRQGAKDTTGADGMFSLTGTGVAIRSDAAAPMGSMRLYQGTLEFTLGETSLLKVEVIDLNGNLLRKDALPKAQPGVYHFDIAGLHGSNRMLIVHASIGPRTETFRYFPSRKGGSEGGFTAASSNPAGARLAKVAADVDSLKVTSSGYATKKTALTSYDATVNVTLEAEPTGGVPKVTPANATSIPSSFGGTVANPGKLTANVSYSAYYWSTSIGSPLPPPNVPKQSTPKTKLCNVYTPPDYDPAIQYPLIIIMHGITDNPNTWVERSNPKIATLFDNLITSKTTKPFIAVFASGTVDNSTNGYYAFGAELVNDLLPFIESKYSVKKDRGSRAMAGFSFGGMQTLSTGLCTHLKEFAWFAGLDAAGPGTPSASDIAKYVAAQNPETYPLYYLYIGVGASDGTASGSSSNAANGLATKGPYITNANFSFQNNIPGGHLYPVAEVSLYNFLRMAFSPNY
jgi:hypothetical protein